MRSSLLRLSPGDLVADHFAFGLGVICIRSAIAVITADAVERSPMHDEIEAELLGVPTGRAVQQLHHTGMFVPQRALFGVRPRAAWSASHFGMGLEDVIDGLLGQREQQRSARRNNASWLG